MKIDISLLTGLMLVGTNVLARVAVQGVEQALVTTAVEFASAAGSFVSKAGAKFCFQR